MLKQANLSFSVAAQSFGDDVTSIQFSTQDRNSAKLIFTIREGKQPLNLTDVEGKVDLVMGDKSVFDDNKAVVTAPLDGKLEFTITPEQIRHPGRARGELQLVKKDGQSIGGFRFNFTIKKALVDEYAGPVKEYYVQDLETIKAEIRKTADSIKNLDVVRIDTKLNELEQQLEEGAVGVDEQARQEIQEVSTRLVDTTKKLKTKFMHISADDVINLFQDLTAKANTYTSIFQNPVLAFLKRMHDNYGMVFSGYVFYIKSDGTFNLSQATNKFASEFTANSDWLKFGFHSNNSAVNYGNATAAKAKDDYEQVMVQLYRILGSWECIDKVPRLHNYAGNIDAIKAMRDTKYFGILGLLNAEDTRTSYYHSPAQATYLQEHDRLFDPSNSITFFATDIRLENVSNVTTTLNQRKTDINHSNKMHDLVIFTHEEHLSLTSMQQKIEESCQFAVSNGYKFDFPMNIILSGATGGISTLSSPDNGGGDGGGGAVVVFDDFNRADSSTLGNTTSGHPWIDIGVEKFGIANNQVKTTDNLGTSLALVDAGLANISVSADFIRGKSTDALALVARCDGTTNNFVRTTLDNGTNNVVNLHRVVEGAGTMITTFPYTFVNGRKYNLRLVCVGDTFKVYVDGEEVINVRDENPLVNNTKCGMRLYKAAGTTTATIDNFQVTPL